MSKRTAISELSDKNWDQEDKPEEAGVFVKANEAALKERQIITAKRRNPEAALNSKSAFSGFGGVGFKPTQTTCSPTAEIEFEKPESDVTADDNKQSDEINISKSTAYDNKQSDEISISKSTADDNKQSDEISSSKSPNKQLKGMPNDKNESDAIEHNSYLSNLKALNHSVTKWISQHVDKNPYCILTPIFKDYDKHLGGLKMQKTQSIGDVIAELKMEESAKDKEDDAKSAPKTGLTFRMGILNTQTKASLDDFKFKPSTDMATNDFSFAVGSSQEVKVEDKEKNEAEEEYIPPKVETVEHKEEGSLYNKKCKLFYQNDEAWLVRGIGILYLKKVDDIPQLLVRADNLLGNILLNVRLSEAIIKSLSRQGKNNIRMICIPNPPIPKITGNKLLMMLIQVKTGEDADELLGKMKEMLS